MLAFIFIYVAPFSLYGIWIFMCLDCVTFPEFCQSLVYSNFIFDKSNFCDLYAILTLSQVIWFFMKGKKYEHGKQKLPA